MRKIVLCLLALLCARGFAAEEGVMQTLLSFKETIPTKAALADIAIRAKREYGVPIREIAWRYQDGKFACAPLFASTLRSVAPIKDDAGLLTAVRGEAEYDYLLYLPDGYDESREYPVLLFLHGIGERGGDPSILADYGPFQYVLSGRSLPMIVIAPQLEADFHWVEDADERETDAQMRRLTAFLEQMCARYAADGSRVYLSGLSMGGRGAYKLACYLPDAFAAVAVCCGRAGVWNAPDQIVYNLSALAETPVWIFHGLSDQTVDPDHALAALRALLAHNADGNYRLTLYPAVGHGCWEHAYMDGALYDWLLGYSK